MEDVDNGGGYAGVGQSIWEISEPSVQFCCEPKTPLKNSHKKKKICEQENTWV